MKKIDLITGFLGSGKTTFLIKYAKYLITQGEKVGVVVNDHGAVNVDMVLIHEALGDSVGLEMVIASDPDCHTRRLKTKLISFGMQDYTRIIVEPSGVYDPEELYDLIREEPLDRWYEPGSVITILDPTLTDDLSREARYLLAVQAASAGMVIMSKTQLCSDGEKEAAICALNAALAEFKCRRRYGDEVLKKPWNQLTESDLLDASESGYRLYDMEKLILKNGGSFSSIYYLNRGIAEKGLSEKLKAIFSSEECGNVIRIKGMLPDLSFNATKNELSSEKKPTGKDCVIVIGESLNKEKIDEIMLKDCG